tara:strand:+ start:215 stop:481 length:267 start_codon:yes stop_codon:yes gene_type:complete
MNELQKIKSRRLLKTMVILGPCTLNQAVDYMWAIDLKKGFEFMISKGWRYYVFFNKYPARLKDSGNLKEIGKNENGEKIWEVIDEVVE